MALETGVIPQELQGVYSQDPYLPLPEPMGANMLDLLAIPSMSMGSVSNIPSRDVVQSGLDAFSSAPASMNTLAAPVFFDYDAAQVDRYKGSANFNALGFDPSGQINNEYKYGARQTWGDVWSNGLSGMFSLAGNTFVEGWKGWGNMADAIASTSWAEAGQDLIGTPEYLLEQDKITKDIMNKYAIYSTPESEEGIFNRKFFGDMLQQSGFAVGAIGQFLSEELLTYGMSTAFSLSKLGLRAPSWVGRVVSHADLAKDAVSLGTPIWKARSVAEGLVTGARKFVPFADTAYDLSRYGKAGAGIGQMAAIGVGGLRRTLAEANMAMTEARMEAAGTYGELYNKLYDEELRKTGQAPSFDIEENIKSTAMNAAQDNFGVNVGILMLSNRLQFDNMFSRFGTGRSFFGTTGEFADDVLKVTGKSAAKEAGEATTKAYVKGRLGTFGLLGEIAADFGKKTAAWQATKSLGRNLFKWETTEGLQELFQEGSNKGLSDYYYDLYHGQKGYDSKLNAIVSNIDNPLTDIQGAKTFLMGALTGRLLSPINFAVGKAKLYGATTGEQRQERKQKVEEAVTLVNAFYENPSMFLNEHIANVKVQDRAAQSMEEAIRNRDQYEFVNHKDGAFAKMMSAAMKTDMFKAVTSTIRDYGEAFNDEEFKEAFGLDKTQENISSVKEYFNKVADETESFHKTWKQLKDKFGDSVMLDLYKEGTPEYATAQRAKRALDDAIEILATNNYKATRSAERAVRIQKETAAIPGIGSSVASAFRVLGAIKNTETEIELLQSELAGLQAVEKKDKATKDLIKVKKAQLKSLEDWRDNHESFKEKGVKQKRKFNKARKSFESYMTSKNQESGVDQEVKLDQMQEIYEKMVDYIELNKDSKDYIDAYNTLANPIKFVQVHQRLLDAMDAAKERLNEEHIQEVLEAISGKKAATTEEGKDQEAPDFTTYMMDAYESMKRSEQIGDISFEEWLNTPSGKTFTQLYNKKYNKNESTNQEVIDRRAALQALKEEFENAETITDEFAEGIFNKLSSILGVNITELENDYTVYGESLVKEIKQLFIDLGIEDPTADADRASVEILKYTVPKFIDKLIANDGLGTAETEVVDPAKNLDIIELPKRKTKMTKPTLQQGESLIDDGKNGIFIVKAQNGLYQIFDSERNNPIGDSTSVSYTTRNEAFLGRDEMIDKITNQDTKDRSFYVFDGKEIRAGLVLTDNQTGKQFVVDTKGEPIYAENDTEKKNPSINIFLLRNRAKVGVPVNISNLSNYTIKQKVEALETGEVIDTGIFRLVRTNELSRIYPFVDRSTNESEQAAQARLDNLLRSTDAKTLAAGITIKIKENPKSDAFKNVSGNKKVNPNLVQGREKYQIQILFNGAPIGFLTNYDNLRYVNENGANVPISNLSINQFRKIFDSQGKDPEEMMIEFKANFESSRAVYNALSQYVKSGQEIEIPADEVAKILKFNIGSGESSYVEEGQAGTPFKNLQHNTINGFYYIIDRSRRYGKGFTFQTVETAITNAVGKDRKEIEKQIALVRAVRDTTEQLGRYMAVVKLPNGRIHFVELTGNPMSDGQLTDIITKLNERSIESKSKNSEVGKDEKNQDTPVRKKIDFNEELNSEIASSLFISVPQSAKGTYIDFALNDTGSLELTFHKKEKDKDIRRQIYVYGKTKFDPFNFKDADDMLEQINAAIEKHDKEYAKNDSHKIGFKLTKQNFKAYIPDAISVSQLENSQVELRSSVYNTIVKNLPLTVKAVAVNAVDLPAIPQTVEPTTPQPASKNKELTDAERQAVLDQLGQTSTTTVEDRPIEYGEVFVTGTILGQGDVYGNIPKYYPDRRGDNEYNAGTKKYFKEEVIQDKKIFTLVDTSIVDTANRKGFVATSILVDKNSPTTLNDVKADLEAIHARTMSGVESDRKVNKAKVTQALTGVRWASRKPTAAPAVTEAKPAMTELEQAKMEVDTLIRDKELEVVKRRDEKIANGMRPSMAMMEANTEASSMFDKKIKQGKDKINQIKNAGRNTALKITNRPTFDQGSVVNIDDFKKYISRILGDKVSVQELDFMATALKDGQVTVGKFLTYLEILQNGKTAVKGRIEVGANTGFKYHEAFHAVFRLMLTDKQIDKLLAYTKIEVNKKGIDVKAEMQKMRELHTIYAEMNEQELEERFYEEYMADQFEDFKGNQKDSKTLPGIRGWFQKLFDLIKSLFNRFSRNELTNLFREIDRGAYRNNKVRENRFTKEDAVSISEPVLKAIKVGEVDVLDENGMYITIPRYLSQQEGDQLASNIASKYHLRVLNGTGQYNKMQVLNEIFADFMDLYDINGSKKEFYLNEIDTLYEQDPDLARQYQNKLQQKYQIFVEDQNRKSLAEAVDTHLKIMGYQQELEDDELTSMEDEFGSRVTTDNWKETHSIGGFGSLSKFLRQYIAATTYVIDKDEFGNTEFVNGEPLIQAVNANLVYNGVLKAVSNITDQNQFVNRLQQLRSENTETGKFLNKFFNDVDLNVDPTTGGFSVDNAKQSTLFQMVIKGFQQYTVDYIFINKDIRQSKKVSALMIANRMGVAKTQFTQWQNAYVQVFEDQILKLKTTEEKKAFAKEQTGALQDLITYLDAGAYISDEDMHIETQRISNELKENLGISLSPLFLKFSISAAKDPGIRTESQRKLAESYSDVTGITIDSIRQIVKSVQALENPFAKNIDSLKKDDTEIVLPGEANDPSDLSDDMGEGGNVTRINELAKGNAIFDETVSSTSYKNAEGELVYSHQLPTFHLVKVNSLNDPSVLDDISQDDFVSGNILLDSSEFRNLVGDLRVERIEGMKSSILNETADGGLIEDKTITSNQNKGITYGSFSDREFIISLLELYKYNKEVRGEGGIFYTTQHLIRVIEASNTADTVALPVIKAVETDSDNNTKLSKEAVEHLAKEVAREFARIQKVGNEIRTKVFEEGEIEGYHYAVDQNGFRDSKKKPRGVKFYKMANMLGKELAEELEADATNPAFDLSTKTAKINARIQEYWAERMDEFVDALNDLGVITISNTAEAGETIANNLVDDFITTGFTTKGDDKKAVADERKNSKLNLIPGSVRHNLGQILINDYINTLAFNQLLYGDEAKAFKDEIDQVKRARGANGSGPSLESIIISPELGITEQFTKSHILTFTDPKYKSKYAGGLKDKADAQSYTTVKGMRYTLFGLGQLTPQRAKILDKLEAGVKLTADEIFGPTGLKSMEGMFNSYKLVYFDGPQYIKTSTVMLTKEFTSMQVDGRWIARIGYEELHDLRERMETFEAQNSTVTFSAPKSASKAVKKNVFDSKLGFRHASNDNFIEQSTKYWRLQLVNPSNKISITDPTQAKQIIIAEQDDTVMVDFMGSNMSVGDLKKLYLQDTDQRIKNNYFRARNEIFDIEKGFEELGKSINQDKVTAKLEKFQKRAIENLRASGADSQLLEFFSLDEETGKPKYNLNSTLTLEKYTQLFLAYFSKGIMSEKSPGHSVALMSNYGVKTVKVFTGRYDEDGVPIGRVVPRAIVEADPKKYMTAKRWDNEIDRTFTGLVEGDIYVDDLRHNVPEYDDNGKIIGRYAEFMMPPHFMEDMNLKPGDPIPDWIAKIFGVRIPSQDKHSFISLKLVDFMPAYYGSTAVFPHELIEISGADFDIDKLYMHIADTYTRAGKRVAYGTAKTKEGKFEEFVRWNSKNNKAFRDELNRLKETDPTYQGILKSIADLKKLEKGIDKAFENTQMSDESIKEGFSTAVQASRLVDAVRQKLTGMPDLNEFSDQYGLVEDTYFVKDLQDTIDSLDKKEERDFILSMGSEWYDTFKDLNNKLRDVEARMVSEALKSVSLPASITQLAESKTELNNGVLNNKILSQKMALLNNDHITKGGNKAIGFEVASVKGLSDLLDPAVTDNLLDILSIGVDENGEKIYPKGLKEILVEGGSDVDSLIGKLKAYKNNKEGSRNIGPAVNAMLTYAILNNFGIQLRDNAVDPKSGELIKMFKFKLNGHVFSGYGNTRSYNVTTGKYDSDQRIFNTISTLVSAMTDNAKERLAARLGLNIEAVGHVSNMVAQGVPLKSAILFMLQPAIREYFEMTKIAANNVKTAAEGEIFKSQIAKELLNKYRSDAGEDFVKEDLTDEILIENIKNNGSSATYQASVLEDFMGIVNQSKYYSSVAQVLKLTKGLGTSFEEYDKINDNIDALGLRVKDDKAFEEYIDPINGMHPPFDLRQTFMGYDQTKPYHNFIEGYIKIADQISQISKGMFLERTAVFKRIEQIVKDNLSVRMSLRERFNTELKKDLISYLSIKAYRKYLADNGRTGTLSTMTNALIYDQAAESKGENFMDIVDIMKTIREKLPNNYLANQFLNVVSTSIYNASGEIALNPKNKDGINKIEANTWAKLSEYQVEKLRDAFTDIYQSEIDFDGSGKNGRDMANALFNYLVVKDGAQFRSGSFIRYIPNFIFTDFLTSTGLANDVLKLSATADNVEELDEKYKQIFGVTSTNLFNEFMENYVTHIGNSYYVKKMPIANESKFEPTGNKAVDEFQPASIVETEKGISINIFRGARDTKAKFKSQEEALEYEAGLTYLSDTDYLEYLSFLSEEELAALSESKAKTKKFNADEKARFKKNMQSLRDKGFNTSNTGEVKFPYIIKVSSGERFKSDTYYILKSVQQATKDVKKGPDSKRLIQKGQTVAQGISAYYEKIERKGASKTYKGGAIFDPIPETASIPRYRKPVDNTTGYHPFYTQKAITDPGKYQMFLENMGVPRERAEADTKALFPSKPVDTGSRSMVTVLLEDYGITTSVQNKGITFEGEMFEILKENISAKEFEKINSPADLLKLLGYKDTAAAPRVSIATEESTESMKSTEDSNKSDLDSVRKMIESSQLFSSTSEGSVDSEEVKRRIAMFSANQNPLNDECAS